MSSVPASASTPDQAGEASAGAASAPSAPFFKENGDKETVELPADYFGSEQKASVLYESVRSRLAAVRAGTHSTKTRGEVSGGGVKPWRQKGTGRARHGSIREPQWVGGGIAHGPRPRRYELRVNKKAKAAALKAALTSRARDGRVIVVEMPSFDAPKTKRAAQLLTEWEANGKVIVVFDPSEQQTKQNSWKSFRNLPLALPVTAAAPYTVLEAETVVFTRAALDALAGKASSTPRQAAQDEPGSEMHEQQSEDAGVASS